MKVVRCKDYNEVSSIAAKIVQQQIIDKPDSVLGLATGETPVGLYNELIKMYKNGEVDFTNIKTFNLDEYYPIKRNNEQSYYFFMHKIFFEHINVKAENINILNGEASDIKEECECFENLIAKSGGIDLQILGIGQNGHIGFNEPGEFLECLTHIVELTKNTIEANSRFFDDASQVPTKSLTMGIKTILGAKKIILLASGKNKSDAVKSMLSGKITTHNPSTFLNLHNDVTLVIDESVIF